MKERVIQILDKHLGQNYLLFLFGSQAKDTPVRSSDIDLAVYRKEIIPSSLMAKIREELEENAGTLRDIALINLTEENINTNLLKAILKEGIIWKGTKNSKELLKDLRRRLSDSK